MWESSTASLEIKTPSHFFSFAASLLFALVRGCSQSRIIESKICGHTSIIKVTMSVRVGSAWILPVTARSLFWGVGGRESLVKHGAGGPARAGEGGTGGEGPGEGGGGR